ncbi:MAG: hypothetical protein KC933_04655 [Myxococcales bacterium]|nr:hypothetical protein [Myxococcales bacterium]
MTSRAHLPKLSSLPKARAQAARRAADALAATLDLEPYRLQRTMPRPNDARPVLHLEDLSVIPFLDGVPGVELYQHRARVRAADGDLYAAVSAPVEGYDAYCERIGLGHAHFVAAAATGSPLEVAKACAHGAAFAELARHARASGGLVVHPYMANAAVWALAAALHDETGEDVTVIGPPPPVMWIANDKAAFCRLVADVLGEASLVRTEIATTAAQAAEHLGEVAGCCDTVGLKRARCASAMGNRVLDSQEVLRRGPDGWRAEVEDFLTETKWDGEEELLVVEWLRGARSPSTQLWIPPEGMGDPVIDGVYEQLLEHDHGVFFGSRPSRLGPAIDEALAVPSLLVAVALQRLGYVGRCSFDLLLADQEGGPDVRFSECNGRWGGTSTPMHLVDRLVQGPRPHYRAQDFVHPGLLGARFNDVLATLGEQLYDPVTGKGTFILYNVGPLAASGKLDVIALGASPEHADELMEEALPKALGLT